MFASGAVLREVPIDPELPFLFDGEEVCAANTSRLRMHLHVEDRFLYVLLRGHVYVHPD